MPELASRNDWLVQASFAAGMVLACGSSSDVQLGLRLAAGGAPVHSDGGATSGTAGRSVSEGGASGASGAPGSGGTGASAGQSGLSGEPFGCPTSLSGTVYAPSGSLPLYNVVVYVPGEPLAPISEGASCRTCDGYFSGKPLGSVLSDAAGKFTLSLDNIPRTDSLPLVVQVGKWRRQLSVPVRACQSNTAEEGSVRLPRDRTEGNLPKIALARGGSDAPECLLRKLGISDPEFTTDSGDGRVHLYASLEGTAELGTALLASGEILAPPSTLYASLDKMMLYDAVILSCEGNGRSPYRAYGALEFGNVHKYADQGGRLLGSDYHSYWIRTDKFEGVPQYPVVAKFASEEHDFGEVTLGTVNQSFPKGRVLSEWLVNVGASTVLGTLPIRSSGHRVDSIVEPQAQKWIEIGIDTAGHLAVPQFFSFATPVGGSECGSMTFADPHVSADAQNSGKVAFPNGCRSTLLSPQEKAFAFLLFDSASCVDSKGAPVMPVIER